MKRDDFLYLLARTIHLLPFESRKDSQAIFSYILRFQHPSKDDLPALFYVCEERPEVLIELCRGYAQKESYTPCGMVLREILKHERVTAVILHDQSQGDEPVTRYININAREPVSGNGVLWDFFRWIDESPFEISADALNTFRVSQKFPHNGISHTNFGL